MFTFFVFDRKYSFMANLVLTFITICLKWNFVSRLFRIYRIRWWYSFFDQNYSFWTNFVQKIKIFSLCWNLVLRLIRICRTSWWCSLFFIWFFFDRKYSFMANLVTKFNIVCFKWSLVPTIMFTIFSDFLMVEQIFVSPQVKQSVFLVINWYIRVTGRLNPIQDERGDKKEPLPIFSL